MTKFLRRWFAPINVTINLPESIIMAALDDLKTVAAAIIANQATLAAENAALKTQVADLTAQVATNATAAADLATEDAGVAEVAAQLNAAIAPTAA